MKSANSIFFVVAFTIATGSSMLGFARSASAQPQAFTVFSTNPQLKGEELDPGDVREQFSCDELIYAITGFEGIEPGSYTFTTRWLGPNGQAVKEDRGQLEMHLKGQVAYLATSLKIQTENQGADEASPFSGTWRVEVLYLENLIGSAAFELAC